VPDLGLTSPRYRKLLVPAVLPGVEAQETRLGVASEIALLELSSVALFLRPTSMSWICLIDFTYDLGRVLRALISRIASVGSNTLPIPFEHQSSNSWHTTYTFSDPSPVSTSIVNKPLLSSLTASSMSEVPP
jgi:hypothetical protein